MASAELGKKFRESTKGRVVALLRRGTRTVDDLALELGMTDNAIRSHLVALERDGLVQQSGVRRGPGAGKPAVIYELSARAEQLLSAAYEPVLSAVLEELVESVPERVEELMRKAGLRLASESGVVASGTIQERARAAAELLAALGGDVEVEEDEGVLYLKGCGCPLASVVSRRPEVCQAMASLVSEIAGARAESQCLHGERPRCRFRMTNAA